MTQYASQWQSFRRITRCGIAALVFAPSSFVTGAWLVSFPWGVTLGHGLILAGILSWISLMVLGAVQTYFRCPRCGNFFSLPKGDWFARPSIRRRCVNCGLRLYKSCLERTRGGGFGKRRRGSMSRGKAASVRSARPRAARLGR
jgi:hypothetical protein